jgi:hypothetical protein
MKVFFNLEEALRRVEEVRKRPRLTDSQRQWHLTFNELEQEGRLQEIAESFGLELIDRKKVNK